MNSELCEEQKAYPSHRVIKLCIECIFLYLTHADICTYERVRSS